MVKGLTGIANNGQRSAISSTGRCSLRPVRSGGFALMLVMMLLALAVVLGVSYMSSASVKMASSRNLLSVSESGYASESGLEHALYVMQTNYSGLGSSSVSRPLGPYYVNSSRTDYYTFYGVPDAVTPGKFTVYSNGWSGKVQTVRQMTVLCAGAPMNQVAQGVLIGGGLPVTLPSTVQINGDFAVNGSLVNSATIKGNVTSSGVVFDSLHKITGTVTNGAPVTAAPNISWSQFSSYTLYGITRTAASEKVNAFNSNDAYSNGNTITATNPGGVALLAPISNAPGARVMFYDHTHFQGTVVVNGDIEIAGTDITFTAVNGFPSLVVTGHVYVDNGKAATFNGLVVAHQGFTGGDKNSVTTINGGLISDSQGYASNMGGTNVVNYNAQQSKVFDMSPTAGSPVVEITAWGH
jgi:hypothetical protein